MIYVDWLLNAKRAPCIASCEYKDAYAWKRKLKNRLRLGRKRQIQRAYVPAMVQAKIAGHE